MPRTDDGDECLCGHVYEDHDQEYLTPCKVEGCDCEDYEPAL